MYIYICLFRFSKIFKGFSFFLLKALENNFQLLYAAIYLSKNCQKIYSHPVVKFSLFYISNHQFFFLLLAKL